ncbi:MAG: T9SS type A sorting domain-containing protein [Bacteroidota bacterium]
MADLNIKEVVGPVTFELWDVNYSTSETFPLIIGPYAGMSATNTVKFKPKAGVTTTVTGSSTSGIVVLYGVNYITLDGSNSGGTDKNLTWENSNTAANTYVIGVFNYNGAGASNCTIKNCLIKASSQVTNSTYAIILNAAGGGYNNIVIDNNTIFSARYGMQFAGVSTSLATNGQITNNIIGSTVDASAIQYRGILLSYADNTLISGNEIMGAPAGNANTYQTGIYIISGVTNTKIRKNKIHDFYYTGSSGYASYGIYYGAESTTPTEISNNIIYAIKSDGDPGNQNYDPAGIYLFTGGNCQIYYNTINMTGATLSSTYLSFSACISIANGIPNLDIQDNILKNSMTPVSGTGNKTYAIYNAGANSSFTPINYNNYFVDGINPNIGYQGADQATLAAWKAATGQDASSVNLNPAFVSATDFHPTNAAMGHLGVYLSSVPTDFTGVSRTSPPDHGVYEYSVDPVVTTVAATLVATNTATLNASTNPWGFTVNTFFDYGMTTAYGSTLAGSPSSATGSSVTAYSAAVSSLVPGTTYHFRARVVTTGGLTAYGNDFTFTTLVPAPSVVTTAATAITANTATLNGTVNANGSSTVAKFEYGPTIAYGTLVTAVQSPVTGSTVTPINIGISGLQPNTLYHFRAVGTNLGGTVNGADLTFTTLAEIPTVITNIATNIQPASAQLNGTVTAKNAATTVTFEYGLTTSYGSSMAATPATVTGNTATPVLANISGLTGNTTYHFRCVGVNSAGTVNGADQSFLTGCPVPSAAGTISGPINVCKGGTGYIYTVPVILNASTYNWTVPTGATITAGGSTNSITVSYSGTAVSGNITVYGSSVCGSGTSSSLGITVNPLPVPTITGPASVCINVPGNIFTTETGMTGYTWTVAAGGTITAGTGTNAITVTWTTAGAKTVTVNYTTASGCTAATATSYAVTVNALPTPTITGNATACQNSSSVYTTQTGMTGYTWTVSAGGTITAGAGTNAITVLWTTTGAKVVTANYTNATGCTATAPGTFNVTVNAAAAPTIGSNNDPCVGSTGNMYYTESGMLNYVWTVSAGGAIVSGQGTSAINVTWTGVGSQTVTVNYNNAAGCPSASPAVYNLFVNPLPAAAGTITGTNALCAGTNGVAYSCGSVMNATSYTWTLPAGATIATGAGTTSITVNFGSAAIPGNITVSGTNSCGNGTPSPAFAVAVSPLPAPAGAITGPASVCAGSTGVAYSVPAISNATSYVWTVPVGATITSGATTRNIVVSFGTTAGSGTFTVKGTNSCGSGTVSPGLNVTINAIPAAPVITATGNLLTSSASTGNQWYYEGTAITGATGQTYTVTGNTGFYWCVVTLNGCSSPISNKVWVVITGVGELSASRINVYPVPNDGRFTVSITSPAAETYSIQVFDQVGRRIYEISDLQVNGTVEKQIDLRPVAGGVYSVVIMNRDRKVVKKVLIN